MNQCIDVQADSTPNNSPPTTKFVVTLDLYEKLGFKIDLYGRLAIVSIGNALIGTVVKVEAKRITSAISLLEKAAKTDSM